MIDLEWQANALASLVAWAGLGIGARALIARLDARRRVERKDR